MKNYWFITFAFAFIIGLNFRPQDREQIFQQAYYLEIGQLKLDAAIKLYQKLGAGDDLIAIKALQRLLICYDQLGKTKMAKQIAEDLFDHQLIQRYISHPLNNEIPSAKKSADAATFLSTDKNLPTTISSQHDIDSRINDLMHHPAVKKYLTQDQLQLLSAKSTPLSHFFLSSNFDSTSNDRPEHFSSSRASTISSPKVKTHTLSPNPILTETVNDTLAKQLLADPVGKKFIKRQEALSSPYLFVRCELNNETKITFHAIEGEKNKSPQQQEIFLTSDALKLAFGAIATIQDEWGNSLSPSPIAQSQQNLGFANSIKLKQPWLPGTYCRLFYYDANHLCKSFFFRVGNDLLFLFPGLAREWNDPKYVRLMIVLPTGASVTNPLVEAKFYESPDFQKNVRTLSEAFKIITDSNTKLIWDINSCDKIIVKIHIPGFDLEQTNLHDLIKITTGLNEGTLEKRLLVNYFTAQLPIPYKYFLDILNIAETANLVKLDELKIAKQGYPENKFSHLLLQRRSNFRLIRIELDQTGTFHAKVNELFTNKTKNTLTILPIITNRDIISDVYDDHGKKFQVSPRYGPTKWNEFQYRYEIPLNEPLAKRGKIQFLCTLKPQAKKELFSIDGEDIIFFMQPIKTNWNVPECIELVLPKNTFIRETSQNIHSIQYSSQKILIKWLNEESYHNEQLCDKFYMVRFQLLGVRSMDLDLDSFDDVICSEQHHFEITQNNKQIYHKKVSLVNRTSQPISQIVTNACERAIVKITDQDGHLLNYQTKSVRIAPWYYFSRYPYAEVTLDKPILPGQRLTYHIYYQPEIIKKKKEKSWLYFSIPTFNGNTHYSCDISLPGERIISFDGTTYLSGLPLLPEISTNDKGQQVLFYDGYLMWGDGELGSIEYQ